MSITGSSGTKAVSKRYPAVEGITAETTKQRSTPPSLQAEGIDGKTTIVRSNDRKGIV